MSKFTRFISALAMAAAFTSAAVASELDDIKKSGTVRIGVLAELPPWSSMAVDGKLSGYDLDVANLLAQKMGVKPEFTVVTTPNRIAQLMSKKLDLLIAVVGMYPDRAKVVQFSQPYAALDILVIGKKSDKISTLQDIEAMKIGTPKGSAQEIAITKALPKTANILRFDDDATTIQSLLSGQAQVIGGNTTYMMKINQVSPGNYEPKVLLNRQFMGVAMRPGDKELNQFVNAFIDEIKANGQLNAINQKWLGTGVPEFPAEMPGIPYTVQ